MRWLLGIVIGLLPLGGYLVYERLDRRADPCIGRCGSGTRCEKERCVALPAEPAEPAEPSRRGKRKRRGGRAGAAAGGGEPHEPPLRTPSAADLRASTQGPSLGGTDVVDMSEAGDERELSSAEVDRRFRLLDTSIVACIDRAREGWAVQSGQVSVAFRIERSGKVQKVQVSSPALLQRNGLHRCIAPLVTRLTFPASSRALTMRYPYRLE